MAMAGEVASISMGVFERSIVRFLRMWAVVEGTLGRWRLQRIGRSMKCQVGSLVV